MSGSKLPDRRQLLSCFALILCGFGRRTVVISCKHLSTPPREMRTRSEVFVGHSQTTLEGSCRQLKELLSRSGNLPQKLRIFSQLRQAINLLQLIHLLPVRERIARFPLVLLPCSSTHCLLLMVRIINSRSHGNCGLHHFNIRYCNNYDSTRSKSEHSV
jgi:hypothetical protein